MNIALLEAPRHGFISFRWEDVYFPEVPFPICDFLMDEQHHVRTWDLEQYDSANSSQFIQELQLFQPVVVGINDHQSTQGLVLERLIKQMFPRALVFFSPQQMSLEELLDKANQKAFNLRHRTKPMAGQVRLGRAWEDTELFAMLPPEQQAAAYRLEAILCEKYALEPWKQYLPDMTYRRNLYMLEILEDTLPAHLPFWKENTLRILDVGAGDWCYAPAVYQFFCHAHTQVPRKVYLTGVELDPYRIDQEGYSRVDYALSYIDPIASYCRYLIQDVNDYKPELAPHVILQFLPLILEKAHLLWGLPQRFYAPQKTLHHLWTLLEVGGILLVANEILPEFEYQMKIWQDEGLRPYLQGAFYSRFRQGVVGFISATIKTE